jgi:uncharacterized membrane protein YkgB
MSVRNQFDDRLEVVGTAIGILLVLIGLATIAGAPWATKISAAAAVLQIGGALATVAVGAGLVWLSRY